jgi:hypothetical protein
VILPGLTLPQVAFEAAKVAWEKVSECACQIPGNGENPKRHAGQFQRNERKNQKHICVVLATGQLQNREFFMPSQNQAATRRGLACFWDRRFAVPATGVR